MDPQLCHTTAVALATERRQHFWTLRWAPELFLELMVPSSDAYSLLLSGQYAGHLLLTTDGCLIELALSRPLLPNQERHFAWLCHSLGIRRVLCYSRDSTLLSLCIGAGTTPALFGLHFREFTPGSLSPLPELRPAVEQDISTIQSVRHNVFETDDEVSVWVRSGWVYVLEEQGRFLGAGLRSPVWPDLPERDIGVLVHPDHREKGHGSRILARLAEDCLQVGFVPTAGCAHDNHASRAALARAGFVSRDSLIEFRLPESGL